jgi:hypothetical protein
LLLTRNERVILAQQTEEVSLRLNQGRKSWHSSAWRWLGHTGPIGADDRAHTGVRAAHHASSPPKQKPRAPTGNPANGAVDAIQAIVRSKSARTLAVVTASR